MPTLTTLAATKRLLAIDTAATTFDTLLGEKIDEVEKAFTEACGWGILTASYTTYITCHDATRYTFDRRPVTAITSLSTPNSFSGDTWTAVSTSDYKLRSTDRGVYYIEKPAGFSADLEYKLVYVAGYATIPADIVGRLAAHAAIEFTKAPGAKKGRELDMVSMGRTDKNIGVSDVFADPDNAWRSLVNRYRVVNV